VYVFFDKKLGSKNSKMSSNAEEVKNGIQHLNPARQYLLYMYVFASSGTSRSGASSS